MARPASSTRRLATPEEVAAHAVSLRSPPASAASGAAHRVEGKIVDICFWVEVPIAMNPLNPEAGNVPIPDDPREVEAAVRAGAITYRIVPYYPWRYGERGERFTHSDSAWLARLSRYDAAHVRNQVGWLASVLANRGMPSSLMELHLRVLDRALSRAVPGRRAQYARLSAAADELREARLSRVAAEDFEALPVAFVERLGFGDPPLLRGVGRLVVAAVADERGGMARAVESLEGWLVDVPALRGNAALRESIGPRERAVLDSEAFASRWPGAVRGLIDEARSRPAPVRGTVG